MSLEHMQWEGKMPTYGSYDCPFWLWELMREAAAEKSNIMAGRDTDG